MIQYDNFHPVRHDSSDFMSIYSAVQCSKSQNKTNPDIHWLELQGIEFPTWNKRIK